MSGLFGTFNIAKRGMFAQQMALDVTSHNVANAKTEGYSRQRVELQTTTPFCTPSLFSAAGPGQLGTGVEVVAVNRVRDSFLDFHTRVELGVQGNFTGRDNFLSQVENILNEPTDTGISTLIGKFFDGWQQLSKAAETSSGRKVVAEQSQALANELNHTYNELQKLKENTQNVIKDNVFDVNGMIKQISQLNQEIIQVSVAGQMPNDLLDRRDLLIDNLSIKFGVKLDKKNYQGMDVTIEDSLYGKKGDLNAIAPNNFLGKPLNLVQTLKPDEASTFSYVSSIELADKTKVPKAGEIVDYKVAYYKKGDMTSESNKVSITVKMKPEEAKQLDECRVLWADKDGMAYSVTANKLDAPTTIASGANVDFNKIKQFKPMSGEFQGYMSVQSDIDNYIDEVNKLAKALAFSVNAVHSQSGSFTADDPANGKIDNFFINTDTGVTDEAAENAINAGNIGVNKIIISDPMKINASIGKGESDGKRALAIAQLRDKIMSIQGATDTTTRTQFVKDHPMQLDSNKVLTLTSALSGMTLDNYFKDTVDKLGIQEQEARRMVKNQATLLKGFKQSRAAVSGVSLDEEMANVVQYQHAYSANAKIISTVDQLLDVVINGLKR